MLSITLMNWRTDMKLNYVILEENLSLNINRKEIQTIVILIGKDIKYCTSLILGLSDVYQDVEDIILTSFLLGFENDIISCHKKDITITIDHFEMEDGERYRGIRFLIDDSFEDILKIYLNHHSNIMSYKEVISSAFIRGFKQILTSITFDIKDA